MKDIIQPNRNVISSGIQNHKPATHLWEYRAWIRKGEVQRPLQDNSNVVIGRVCAGSFEEARGLMLDRMKDLCEKNEVPEDSFEVSFLALKEADLPLV